MFSRCCWRCLRQNEKNRSFSSLLKHNFSQLIVCWVYASVSLSSLVHCYCVVHVIVTHKFCRLFPSSLYFWRQQQETSTLFAIETRLASRSEWQIRCKRRQNKRSLSLSLFWRFTCLRLPCFDFWSFLFLPLLQLSFVCGIEWNNTNEEEGGKTHTEKEGDFTRIKILSILSLSFSFSFDRERVSHTF